MGTRWKQSYIRPPPPYFIVLGSWVTTIEGKAIEFHRILRMLEHYYCLSVSDNGTRVGPYFTKSVYFWPPPGVNGDDIFQPRSHNRIINDASRFDHRDNSASWRSHVAANKCLCFIFVWRAILNTAHIIPFPHFLSSQNVVSDIFEWYLIRHIGFWRSHYRNSSNKFAK